MTPTSDTTTAVVQRTYGGPETWRVEERRTPEPGRGEVLLDVAAAALDRGTWHLMRGEPRMVRLGLGLRGPRQAVPGLDVAGTVTALGSGVAGFAVGDRVFGVARGALAERAVARVRQLAPAPATLTADEAAALAVSGMTALQALEAARVGAGHRVLVSGASGGVGHLVVQLAAARGAEVVAVCSAAKADRVRAWGASVVLDHAHQSLADGPVPYDAIIDIAGAARLREQRAVLAERGSIVFVGAETGEVWTGGYGRPARRALRMVVARQRYVMLASAVRADGLTRLADEVTAAGVRPHVHATYALADAATAMAELEAGRVAGKVVVRVGG